MEDPIKLADLTDTINREILSSENGIIDQAAQERINTKIKSVNDEIKTEIKFSFDGTNLKYGQTEIKIKNSKNEPVSYKEGLIDWRTKVVDSIGVRDSDALNSASTIISNSVGEAIGLEGDALDKFKQANTEAIKQQLKPVLNQAGSDPVSTDPARRAVQESGIDPKNAPQAPRTAQQVKDMVQNNVKFKSIYDSFIKQIGEEKAKVFNEEATKIENDTSKTNEQKEQALQDLVNDGFKKWAENSLSDTWSEKLKSFGKGIIEAFKLLGGLLQFALYLLPAILAIIFAYEFIDKWAKQHTGCLMDLKDITQGTKKTYKVQGLTCTSTYRDAMGDFEDFPDFKKECTTITPIPAPPDGCQICEKGIITGTDDCPCPDNNDSRGLFASKWCDNKFLTSTDPKFSHNYQKKYCSWMDAFEEVAAMIIGFIAGFNPLPEGSFLGKLFQILEALAILALVFVTIYGLLWISKRFGFLGGGDDKNAPIININEEQRGDVGGIQEKHKTEDGKKKPEETPPLGELEAYQQNISQMIDNPNYVAPHADAMSAAETASKRQKEAESKRQQEATESKRQQDEAESKRQQEAAESKRQQEAAESKRQQEAVESKRQQEAAESKRQQDEAESKRQQEDPITILNKTIAINKAKTEAAIAESTLNKATAESIVAQNALNKAKAEAANYEVMQKTANASKLRQQAIEAQGRVAEAKKAVLEARTREEQVKKSAAEARSRAEQAKKEASDKNDKNAKPMGSPGNEQDQKYDSDSNAVNSSLFVQTPSGQGGQTPPGIMTSNQAIIAGLYGQPLQGAQSPNQFSPPSSSSTPLSTDTDSTSDLLSSLSSSFRANARKSRRISRRIND